MNLLRHGLLLLLAVSAILVGCNGGKGAVVDQPENILWVDSAGNVGARQPYLIGFAIGSVGTSGNYSEACRKSANENGPGTATLCFSPHAGKLLKKQFP